MATPRDRHRRRLRAQDRAVRLLLSSGTETVTAVPYLLGFRPVNSIVVLALAGRASRLVLSMRADLPGPDDDDGVVQSLAEELAARASRVDADRVVVVVYPPEHGDLRSDIGEVLSGAFTATRVEVLDVIATAGSGWWSLVCGDPTGCALAGGVLGGPAAARVERELTALGYVIAPGREHLLAEVAAVDDGLPTEALEAAAGAVMERLGASSWVRGDVDGPYDRAELERYRDEGIALGLWLFGLDRSAPRPDAWADDDELLADLLVALPDVRVRDSLLWHLAHEDPATLQRLGADLRRAVQRAPEGAVAPLATIAATCAWLSGDGARTWVLLDRALADDADHALARLLEHGIQAMVPPQAWGESLRSVPLEQCRYGAGGARSA